MKKNKNKRKI
jgi:uncharacterized membrane protein